MAGLSPAAAAAAAVAATGPDPRWAGPRRLLAAAAPVVHAYAQLLFTGRTATGLLLLAATLTAPRVGAHGLAAVLLAQGLVRALHFSEEASARGLHGYNPLLVGLAVGATFEAGPGSAALLCLSVGAVVFLEAAAEATLGAWLALPALSLPFLATTWLALSAAGFLGPGAPWAVPEAAAAAPAWLPGALDLYLRSLGAVIFAPTAAAGALVLAGLLLHSRIAVLLTAVGFAASSLLGAQVFTLGGESAGLVLHANAMLVAVALGGVWFVPQPSAFALAAAAALGTSLATAGALALLRPMGLPVLFLPFNATLLVVLAGMRQRTRDGAPRSVDFAAGAPEANLAYYRTRLARFGPVAGVRLAPPFAGRWTVTQGVDGPHTHRGPWRHALDFEVLDAAGRKHGGAGAELRDYRCYRLPVLAAADGTVVKVVADVPDNPVGERNAREPWGNVVLLHHGPGLYSLVAHLAPGSVEVREGQRVRQGGRLGLCGNSGRSFVPHLHFHLQGTPRLGAPTRELLLADAVTGDADAPVLHRSLLPAEGQALRGLERREEVAALAAFPIGGRTAWEVTGPQGRAAREIVASRIGLQGELSLEVEGGGGQLWFENQGRQLVVFDHVGPRRSTLHLLAAALPRLPYELPPGLAWDDVLPRRRLRPAWARWLADVADPFLPEGGLAMAYRAEREGAGGRIAIHGAGQLGRRAVTTRAVLEPERGPVELTLQVGAEVLAARALEEAP